ncbi:GNAT family N-acetyltransferase [Roseococcus sp. DSY-14]|uniref:GNAT family N-acetyltransferase n=1 Tax=Roseococcus sp. DSY-14 TaxID=3369650 RepID=UPI00387B2E17
MAGGHTVGLALFNRRGGALHLHASGDPALDRPFIEHNAPLVAAGAPAGTAAALLRAAWGQAGRLVLPGVPPALAEAAGGVAWRRQLRPSPCIDLAAARAAGGWLATLSANTRQQLRRSDRLYAARGALEARAATTPAEAAALLTEMMALHDRRWGGQGAFATPWLRRFHAELAQRLLARGELELLRVSAGGATVGILHNLRRAGRVFAYQAGWAAEADTRMKPGLTCHHQAIARALDRGDAQYDLLAGGQRYKASLAGGGADLAWVELVRPWSPRGLLARLRRRGSLQPGGG